MKTLVDFNNSTIVGKSRTDIINIIIINRWDKSLDAIEEYYKNRAKGFERGMVDFQSKIASLYHAVKQIIIDELPKEKTKEYLNVEQIKQDILSGDEDRVFKAWDYIDRLLYVKGITKIDKKELYDKSDIFGENLRTLGESFNQTLL